MFTSNPILSIRAVAVGLLMMGAPFVSLGSSQDTEPLPPQVPPLPVVMIDDFDDGLPVGAEALFDLRVEPAVLNGAYEAWEAAIVGTTLDPTLADGIHGGAVPIWAEENPRARESARLRVPIPPGTPVEHYHALRVRLLVYAMEETEEEDLAVRFYAEGERDNGAPVQFYRRLDVPWDGPSSAHWCEAFLPLAAWRWSDGTVGAWSGVSAFCVLPDENTHVILDDLALVPPGDAHVPEEWTRGVHRDCEAALTGRSELHLLQTSRDGGFVGPPVEPIARWLAQRGTEEAPDRPRYVAVYAEVSPRSLSENEAHRLCWRLDAAAAFFVEVFDIGGEVAVARPDVHPICLIYDDRDDYVAYFERLGDLLNVHIRPPGSGGYTVERFAGCYWDPRYDWERPTFLHESVHAMLPLLAGIPLDTGRWIHEAIANYVQLFIYPDSLERDAYVEQFHRSITRRSFFRPLSQVTGSRISTSNYMQLASLFAYLLEDHSEWLPALANSLARTEPFAEFLQRQGTSLNELQVAWYRWGRQRFAEELPPTEDGSPVPAFPIPPQWPRDDAPTEAAGE